MAAKVEKEVLAGRIFFDKPVMMMIGEDTPMERSLSPIADISGGVTDQMIRTKSCRGFSLEATPVKYAISKWPSNTDLEEYLKRNEVHGYGEGAVVARRHVQPTRFLYPHQWGFVFHINRRPGVSIEWGPYQVRWLSMNEVEGAWAEDLVIIHSCLDRTMLCDLVEGQGVDVSEAREAVKKQLAV